MGSLSKAKTLLHAICLLVNSIRRIKRFFYVKRKTMRTHETTIGEGSAYVTCGYEFDDDGDLDTLLVMFNGVDIADALTLQQLAELEDICRAAAKADYEESKWDTAIDNYIERATA